MTLMCLDFYFNWFNNFFESISWLCRSCNNIKECWQWCIYSMYPLSDVYPKKGVKQNSLPSFHCHSLGPMKVFVQSFYCVSKVECIIATLLGPMKVFVWNFYCVLKLSVLLLSGPSLGIYGALLCSWNNTLTSFKLVVTNLTMVEDVRINKGELQGQWNFRASTKVMCTSFIWWIHYGGQGEGGGFISYWAYMISS